MPAAERAHLDHLAIDQLDALVVAQDACLAHTMVLLRGEESLLDLYLLSRLRLHRINPRESRSLTRVHRMGRLQGAVEQPALGRRLHHLADLDGERSVVV